VAIPTKIVFGSGTIDHIGQEGLTFGQKALIVCGKSANKFGYTSKIKEALTRYNINWEVFDEVKSEPSIEDAKSAGEIARHFKSDFVIGIGGGSSIDTAKVVAALATNPVNIADLIGIENIPKPSLPIISIPTTAGSGSEVTRYAVLTDKNEKTKKEIVSNSIIPKVAIIDSDLSQTMTESITAASGMDALTHAIEGIISHESNVLAETLGLKSINLIFTNLEKVIQKPNDTESRDKMSLASLFAGIVIQQVRTGLVHAMARALGGQFNIPHGVANAIVLHNALKFNIDSISKKAKLIYSTIDPERSNIVSKDDGINLIHAIEDLSANIKIPRTLLNFGVTKEAIPSLSKSTYAVERLNRVNPKPISIKDIRLIFTECLSD
jgi:alcohol dehydrogenase|tara:strand:- start:14919 stop:16061 length:1143 start_codon:yes stop_codon:yes gene_type:complete